MKIIIETKMLSNDYQAKQIFQKIESIMNTETRNNKKLSVIRKDNTIRIVEE